ncbi:MAG: formate dehydrogenase family accessory protein FdhD [Bacillales bacterium]|jgi:FdhD protein|nr:formate dehydrogenase family accessory protein FdhD [Bacillales bacterium]
MRGCPEEYPVRLYINQQEIAVFQLTKSDLEDWSYGYLFSEGFITSVEDVKEVLVNEELAEIRITLQKDLHIEDFSNKTKHYTAGCGRGVTFFSMTDVKSFKPITSDIKYSLSYLLKKRSEFAQNTPKYFETGGMHGASILLADGSQIIREDIGRHNAVDKVIGFAFRNGLVAEELVLITTGRISYEMLSKAAKFGFPVVASRTAATLQAIQLAKFLNIEVVGYLRNKNSMIYTGTGRVENDFEESSLQLTTS